MNLKPLDEYPGFVEWLKANCKRTLADLTEEGRRLFSPEITPNRLQNMKQKYGIRRRERKTLPLNRAEKDFIIFHYDGTPPGEMARMMRAEFNRDIAESRVRDYYRFCGITPEEYGGRTPNPK